MYDAVVVGSGPNGLAAAITLAREGQSVLVVEAQARAGGGTRSEELTLPGFVHDVCSAIHPLGVASPFFAGPPVAGWPALSAALLGPLLRVPRHPVPLARFGLRAVLPATTLARHLFASAGARAAFAGLAGHSILDLRRPLTAAFGLVFAATAHTVGWPLVAGGSERIADALVSYLASLGGEVVTGHPVGSLADVPDARALLFDVTPRQLVGIAGDRLDAGYRRRLSRYRYGPGAFKIDYALEGAVPWAAPACARAASVHVGGTLEEIAAAEAEVARGGHPERPFVLCTQPSLFDATRAPAGRHTFWAYCHVPHGSDVDMTAAVEAQIERFAPGFRDRVLARHVMGPAALEAHD